MGVFNIRFFIFLISCISFSQELKHKSFSVNDGLPSSQVYDIYQGRKGNIWFATDKGIARYNGYEFDTFLDKIGSLSSVVLDFYPQDNGEIWCVTASKELFYFTDDFTGFTPYTYNSKLKSFFDENKGYWQIEDLKVENNNMLHLAISNSSLVHKIEVTNTGDILPTFRKKQQTKTNLHFINCSNSTEESPFFYFSEAKKNNEFSIELETSKLEAAYAKQSDLCFYPNKNDVFIVNRRGEKVTTIKNTKPVLSINNLNNGKILIGYYFGGAIIVDVYGAILEKILPEKSVTNGLIDHAGGLWVSTHHSGVYYVENQKIKTIKLPKISSASIHSLHKTNTGDLLVGTENGKAFIYNSSTGFTLIHNEKGNNLPTMVSSDNAETIYIGTNKLYKLYKDQKQEIHEGGVSNLPNSNDSIIDIIGMGSIITKSRDTIHTKTRVRDVISWNNDIYFSNDFGIFKQLTKENSVKICNHRANDLEINTWNNKLYAGTLGNGLKIFDNEENKTFSVKNGLSNNFINKVYIENENTIWLATNGGVNRLKFQNDSITQISILDKKNGLIDNEVRDVEFIGDTLWIATKKGLVCTDKKVLEELSAEKEHFLRIKNVKVHNKIVDLAALEKLTYEENYLEFEIQGISFNNNLTYTYKLEGLDNIWYTTKNRKIRFLDLKPGTYKLHINTYHNDTQFVKNLIVQPFFISKPFWKTWWFIVFIIVILVGSIYLFFKVQVLTYNKGVAYEILRIFAKKLQRKEYFLCFREAGQDVKIKSTDVFYIKAHGNYISIHTEDKKYIVRMNISKFSSFASDSLEYLRIHRSYIVRIDKVISKSKNKVVLKNDIELTVGRTYIKSLDRIVF